MLGSDAGGVLVGALPGGVVGVLPGEVDGVVVGVGDVVGGAIVLVFPLGVLKVTLPFGA